MENEKIPLQTAIVTGINTSNEATVKFNESIFEVRRSLSSSYFDRQEKIFLLKTPLQENDHRPRTVLDQLYNYKGGIVPDTTEAEKSTTTQQVR